ncbi:Phosphotransferase [Candidatus Hepatincolaceae symbiont of Richtersius coronifer]
MCYLTPYITHLITSNFGVIREVKKIDHAFSNKVFYIKTQNQKLDNYQAIKEVILKVPSKTKKIFFNKLQENKIITTLQPYNITPKILLQNPTKYTLFEYIKAPHLTSYDLSQTVISQLADILKTLHNHQCKVNLRNFKNIGLKYLHHRERNYPKENNNYQTLGQDYFKQFKHKDEFLKILDLIFIKIAKFKINYGLCHNDLILTNLLLDTHKKLWIIDFEYASINDIYFDLALLEEILSKEQFTYFISLYFQSSPLPYEAEKLFFYSMVVDYIRITWYYAFGYDDYIAEALVLLKKKLAKIK